MHPGRGTVRPASQASCGLNQRAGLMAPYDLSVFTTFAGSRYPPEA
jgi:hypothetical protein